VKYIDEFKPYRRIMFALGKAFKYTLWASMGMFCYHMYLLKKTEKPEQGFLANETFMNFAKQADWHFYDLKLLLTHPLLKNFYQTDLLFHRELHTQRL